MSRRGPAPHDFPVAETSLRVMKILFEKHIAQTQTCLAAPSGSSCKLCLRYQWRFGVYREIHPAQAVCGEPRWREA